MRERVREIGKDKGGGREIIKLLWGRYIKIQGKKSESGTDRNRNINR